VRRSQPVTDVICRSLALQRKSPVLRWFEERTSDAPPHHKGVLMGLGDKMEEMADKVKSKISGDDATDNPDLETRERGQEASSDTSPAGDDVSSALRDASTAMKGDKIRDEDDDQRHMRY
jgi:hypothetical protein